jgi:hypothetical protein
MAQGVLPFKYELEKRTRGLTGLAGLPLYLDLAYVIGLHRTINAHLEVRAESQGWTDLQVITSLILLNLAGGDCVDDINLLEADEGLCRVMQKIELQGLPRKQRREIERRWRKEKRRTFPSPSAIFRYLRAFHDSEQEKLRQPGKAFIPAFNKHLQGFAKVNRDFLSFCQTNKACDTATLDIDATLINTNKAKALFCYEGFRSYQPLNVWWAEQGLLVYSEFRDGNVPSGYEQLRVLEEAISYLPEGVQKVRLRSDTAGYQHELLKYCAAGKDSRFGIIEFAVGCDITPAFKKAVSEIPEADWHPLYKEVNGKKVKTDTEWAEACFVPNAVCHSKNDPEYRYLVKRTALPVQLNIEGMSQQEALPFPTMEIKERRYKIFGLVTNMAWEGGELINWHHKRCGKSEEAHSIMKEDLAGGKLPSGDFGENAAWWWIMILALNLNAAMKSLALNESWASKRIKAIRFHLINLPGRILERSRQLLIRLSADHPSFELLLEIRRKLSLLIPAPCG